MQFQENRGVNSDQQRSRESFPDKFRLGIRTRFANRGFVVHTEKKQERSVGHILIAEDEIINRMYITSLLRKKGHSYDEAPDGARALELIAKNSYDLILLDFGLPDTDGLSLARKIRSSGNSTPILAVSGYDLKQELGEENLSILQGIVSKPIQESVFFRQMQKILSKESV